MRLTYGMKFVGFDIIREKLYSQISLPLSVNEIFAGSPYISRTCSWRVLPLKICEETLSGDASAMLSFPPPAHPPSPAGKITAHESPATKQMRHTIVAPCNDQLPAARTAAQP